MGKKETTKSTSVQTPTNPTWVDDLLKGQSTNLTGLSAQDPSSFVPGASGLQQLAFGQAPSALGSGVSDFVKAANTYGQRAADWQPAYVTAQQASAPADMSVSKASAGLASLTPDQMARATGTGQASTYGASTINPKDVALADTPSLDTGRITTLMGPYLKSVIASLQADQEQQAGAARARLSGRLAATNAFGDTGSGIARAAQEGELQRARDSALSTALQSGYGQALGAATNELGLQTQTGIANAGSKNSAGLANLTALNDAGRFNSGEINTNARTDATLGTQASTTNAGILSDLARANADAQTRVGLANAGAENDAAKTKYTTLADLSNSNADRGTKAAEANASAWNAGADRALDAGKLFGDLGTATDDSTRKNLALLGNLGAAQRGVATDQAQAPLSVAQLIAQITGQLPLNLEHGQTTNETSTKTSSNPLGSLGSLAMLAAAPFTGGLSLGGMALGGLSSIAPGLAGAIGSGLAGIAPGLTVGGAGLGKLFGNGIGAMSTTLGDLRSGGFI